MAPELMKRRWSYSLRSLRVHWAVWNALLVLVMVAVVLIVLREGVRWTILHEQEQLLIEDANEISLALHDQAAVDFNELTDLLSRKATGHKLRGWNIRLLDLNNTVMWSSIDPPPDGPDQSWMNEPLPFAVEDYLWLVRECPANHLGVRRLILGNELKTMANDLARIDRQISTAALTMLILAPLAGYWVAARSARTVGQLIATAASLRPDHLRERLPVTGSGDELDQLAQTVNSLLDRIGLYLENRRDFIANAAHELRSPLTAMMTTIDVALQKSRSVEDHQQILETVAEEANRLSELVGQLLLLAETDAGLYAAATQAVRLDEVVLRAVDMFSVIAEESNIELSSQLATVPPVICNPMAASQVVTNLIDNALKFTPAGGRIELGLKGISKASDPRVVTAVELSVRDNGCGIPPGDIHRVFDRFFSQQSAGENGCIRSGTGLGLSICRAIVESFGGTINVESTLGKGTTFVVSLPAYRDRQADELLARAESRS